MKKRVLSVFLVLCFVLTLLPAAFADSSTSGKCGDNLTWTLDGDGTLTISGTGKMWDSDYYNDYDVPWADFLASIEKVVISKGVTSIGNEAFKWCERLTNVTIPDSITSIGNSAFYDCSSLTSVTIPDSVTSIGEWAFYGCSSLTSVTIPHGVTSIGGATFWGCSSLTSVTIGNSVTSIGEWAFSDCSSLTSVTIPDSVTSIGDCAFYGCISLTSVTIGNGVTSINDSFSGCVSLKNFTVSESNSAYSSKDGVLFNKNKTKLVAYPAGKTNTSYTIPNSVSEIKEWAFSDCSDLTNVTIPNSVSKISYGTFWGCSSLTSVTIPTSVKSIDGYAFEFCSSLTSVTIPNSVTSIGEWAFSDCSSLTSITIPNSVSKISYGTFECCENLKSVTIPTSVKSIDGRAFSLCDSLSDIYYKGTASQWKAVKVEAFNNPLKNATIHYVPNVPALSITTSAGHPKIYWNAVDGATKYWVYRSTDGKNFKHYDSTTKTSYTNNSTSIGTTYYYKVKAVNSNNAASDYSVSKSILCKPAAPTVSINRSNGKPKLSWKAVSGATKYWIYRSTDGKEFKYFDSTTKTSYTNSDAASGTKYYYRVKAVAVVNGKNVASANSSTKSLFTSLAKPSVSITTSNGKPKLTWKAVTGADKYYVYRSTDGKTFSYWDSTTKTSYVNSGAKKNTKYYYKVKAVCASNSNANSAQSSAVSIKATK